MELKNYYAQDVNGNIVPGATCYLYLPGTTTLATGLQGPTGAPLTNPFNADSFGLVQFAAPNGLYDFRCVAGLQDSTIPIQFADPSAIYPLITQAQDAATAASASASAAAASAATIPLTVADYAAIRAYTGTATEIHVSGLLIFGNFKRRAKISGDVDDGGINILTADGLYTWVRQYQGLVQLYWWNPAGAGGATDDSVAFEQCALATPSGQLATASQLANGIPYPYYATAFVGKGSYNPVTRANTGGKVFTWVMDDSARITGVPEALNGKLYWPGMRVSMPIQPGILDSSNVFSVRAHNTPYDGAGISGLTSVAQLSTQLGYDSCTFYADNVAPPLLISVASATYTLNSFTPGTPLTASQVKQLAPGMIVNTFHTPTASAAFITGWETDGTVVYVTSWQPKTGVTTPAATPTDGPGVGFNPKTKAWTVNTNTLVKSNSYATRATGYELGCSNAKAPFGDANYPQMWGMDVVNLEVYPIERAFTSRGLQEVGFWAEGSYNGFYADNPRDIGFRFRGTSAPVSYTTSALDNIYSINQACLVSMQSVGNVDANSVIVDSRRRRAGNTATVSLDRAHTNRAYGYDGTADYLGTQVISLQRTAFSGGFARFSYDIQAKAADGTSVGVTVNGSGDKSFAAIATNTMSLGSASTLWTTVYAATGTINTSDETQKTEFEQYPQEVLEAFKACFKLNGLYQWLSSVEEKGDSARWHAGFPAQSCVAEFEKRGIDPWKYGWFCRDKKLITVKKKVADKRQVMEEIEEDQQEISIVNGIAKLVTKKVKVEKPMMTTVQVYGEDGKVVLVKDRKFLGQDPETGRNIWEAIESPMTCEIPVMEDYEREYEEEVETDEFVYGIRHTEFIMGMMAALLTA